MNKEKINKLLCFFLLIFVICIISTTLGRYLYNTIRENYLTSKEFYFNSELLNVLDNKVSFSNWGGDSVYYLEFNIKSKLNNLTKIDYDLKYNFTCVINEKDKVTVSLGSEDGMSTQNNGKIETERTISKSQNVDVIKLYIKPNSKIAKDEKITLKLKALTNEPYKKEISATVDIVVGNSELDYTIEDSVNNEYAILNIVNTKADKEIVNITYDYNLVRIDLTDTLFDSKNLVSSLSDSSENEWQRTLDSTKKYITGVRFKLKGNEAKKIKFYKIDRTKDYTYPNSDENSYSFINGSLLKINLE